MFLKEAYNTGDPPPWTRAPAHDGPACKEELGMRAGVSTFRDRAWQGCGRSTACSRASLYLRDAIRSPKMPSLTPHSPPTPFTPYSLSLGLAHSLEDFSPFQG